MCSGGRSLECDAGGSDAAAAWKPCRLGLSTRCDGVCCVDAGTVILAAANDRESSLASTERTLSGGRGCRRDDDVAASPLVRGGITSLPPSPFAPTVGSQASLAIRHLAVREIGQE